MQGRVWSEVVGLLGAEVARGVHLKNVVHSRDLGRVEAERLVEHRALPIRNGARTIEGGEVRFGTRNCWDWGKAQDTYAFRAI